MDLPKELLDCLLIDKETFVNSKWNDNIPFKCKQCNKIQTRKKYNILGSVRRKKQRNKESKNTTAIFCSSKCGKLYTYPSTTRTIFCTTCKKSVRKCLNAIRQHNFCSHTCSATFSNKERNKNGYSGKLSPEKEKQKLLKLQKYAAIRKQTILNEYNKQPKLCKGGCGTIIKFIHRHKRKYCGKCLHLVRVNIGKTYLCINKNHYHKTGYYTSPFAGKVWLESSWEFKVAQSLDENKIKWIRPSPIPWVNNLGIDKKYYPDFYLTDYNTYLDPKNNFCQQTDAEKIQKVKKLISQKLLILNKNELSWESIKQLIEAEPVERFTLP
jgi:hypothetical protein